MAGITLPDRFEVGREIGIGGESRIVEARDTVLDKVVAVKVPADRTPRGLAAFHRSAEMQELIRHPNVVSVLDHSADPKAPFLSMERLNGQTLSQRLKTGRRPDVTESVAILTRIAAGLEATHAAGVVHRDLKPSNIMLLPDGGVKVFDYSIAAYQAMDRRDLRARGGTPGYMAPERIPRERDVPVRRGGPAADLYGLGAIGYELLCGSKPFGTGVPDEVMRAQLAGDFPPLAVMTSEAPRPLTNMIDSMLSLLPNRRPRSAALVRGHLSAMAAGAPTPTDLGAGPGARERHAMSSGFGASATPSDTAWRAPRAKSRQTPAPDATPRPQNRHAAEHPDSRGIGRNADGPGDGRSLN